MSFSVKNAWYIDHHFMLLFHISNEWDNTAKANNMCNNLGKGVRLVYICIFLTVFLRITLLYPIVNGINSFRLLIHSNCNCFFTLNFL